MNRTPAALSLPYSGVPGRRIQPTKKSPRRAVGTPTAGMAGSSMFNYHFGALPKSAGFGGSSMYTHHFGRLRGLQGIRGLQGTPNEEFLSVGALPKSVGFGRLGKLGRFGFFGDCQCHVMTPRKSGFGALGATATAYSTIASAMQAALAASASAQKPAAIASIPNNAASAVPVIHTVAISPQVAASFTAAASAVQAGQTPSVAQAINIIKAAIPTAPNWASTLPAPTKNGSKLTSQLNGLGAPWPDMRYGAHRSLGAVSVGAGVSAVQGGATLYNSVASGQAVTVVNVAKDAAAGAAIGAVGGPVFAAVGAAVGAVIGLISGLFGAKKAVPKVSQTDITNAQNWMAAYIQVAGSVVGRNFTADMINDLMTAIAILDPGFWGLTQSASISVPAVNNFVNNEMPIRLNDFFNGLAATPVGSPVTLRDNPNVLGHGGGHGSTNPQTYSFLNPGVNAPSYVLGPLFAQYMFVECEVCGSSSCTYSPPSCSPHLNAPLPQLYSDIIDWYRSSRPQWDTPQPNVVTGTDLSIAAPTQTSATTFVAPAIAAPVVTTVSPQTGQNVTLQDPSVAQTQTAFQETAATAPATGSTLATAPIADTSASAINALPQLEAAGDITTTPLTATTPVDAATGAVTGAAAVTGVSSTTVLLIAGGLALVLVLSSSNQSRKR